MEDKNIDLFTYNITSVAFVVVISAIGAMTIAFVLVFAALAIAKLPPLAALFGGCALALGLYPHWFEIGKISALLLTFYVGCGGRIGLPTFM